MTCSPAAHASASPSVAAQELVTRALEREPRAGNALVSVLLPTIRARVVRALCRSSRGRSASRCMTQEVDDLSQEVLIALFDDDARALRAWSPHRGGLDAFVSILTEHEVASIMRSGRRRPWHDEEDGAFDVDAMGTTTTCPETRVASDELLAALVGRVRAELGPAGLALFRALVIDGEPIDDLRAATSMTRDALYASRSRYLKLARRLLAELETPGS